MLTQRSEVVNTRSSLAKSSSDLAEGGRGGQQQGELLMVVAQLMGWQWSLFPHTIIEK